MKEFPIDLLDERDRLCDEAGTGGCEAGELGALVFRGGSAGDEPFLLESAEHLGGHRDIGVAMASELDLCWLGAVLRKPAEACEEDELWVGEV